MTSIGGTLRQQRLKRNLDLEQISRELKISSRFLEAIEDERFEKLPGGVFAKSFVRQYARYLGLDDDEYAAAIQQVVEPYAVASPPDSPLAVHPVDIVVPRVEEWQSVGRHFSWSSSLPALALVVVAMLVCSGIYALWQRSRHPFVVHDGKPQPTQMAKAAPPVAQPQPVTTAPVQPPPAPAGDATSTKASPAPVTTAPAVAAVSQPAETAANSANRQPVPQTPEAASAATPQAGADASIPGGG